MNDISGGRRLAAYLSRHPEVASRYREGRASFSAIHPTQYDIAKLCNLACEGCLFFAGDDHEDHDVESDAAVLDRFFASEAERGVNFGQFAGAEPALNLKALRIAARWIPRGVVFTNGTVRIPTEIPYRLHISVWGLGDDAVRLRGANTVEKALRNYKGDERALFVFTINRLNVEEIPAVVRLMQSYGAKLSFNHFSRTLSYASPVVPESGGVNYRRLAEKGIDLSHSPESLERSRELIEAAMAEAPETVIYSRAFGRWILGPEPLHAIDPFTGVATDCGSRTTPSYRHYHTDLSQAPDAKCCTPNVDCGACRLYQQSLATGLARLDRFSQSDQGLGTWLEMWELWRRLNLAESGGASAFVPEGALLQIPELA